MGKPQLVHASWNPNKNQAVYEAVAYVFNPVAKERIVLRVQITVDPSYNFQSSAFVQVLSADKTWTTLATLSLGAWYDNTAWVRKGETKVRVTECESAPPAVLSLREQLFEAGCKILGL